MPYIGQQQRDRIDRGHHPHTAGELNYALTKIALEPLPPKTRVAKLLQVVEDFINEHTESYILYNEVIGAIECAKLEYLRRMMRANGTVTDDLDFVKNKVYRSVVAPYENQKIEQNGDIYPCHS